ncbi:hypothetical protein [Streptosporangium sp. NPDC051022]|uniref:hypothetical protein n=1 Tax=Streptosporangium sp. NPDC051022 TaxID=3155752 RepID=UPI0034247D31
MTIESPAVEEPQLTVLAGPMSSLLRGRFLRYFIPLLLVPVFGLAALIRGDNLLLPFRPIVTLEGDFGSKGDLFRDEEIQRILMRHHLRVHSTVSSSREIAVNEINQYDFVFPSGQPAAELIMARRRAANLYATVYHPFVSPIVIATFRQYALTLFDNGIVKPQRKTGDQLYYNIDMKKFLALVRERRSWDDVGIKKHGAPNGNNVLTHISNMCETNSAGTYMGLVAFVENGENAVENGQEAEALAKKIKPLLTNLGLTAPKEIFTPYIAPEGMGITPLAVVYEHQYLTYQLDRQARLGRPDLERVLLYPSPHFVTQPELISLNDKGDRLGELITRDPEMRRREAELGYRLLDSPGAPPGEELAKLLTTRHLPVPATGADNTRTLLPRVEDLERMIKIIGGCEK